MQPNEIVSLMAAILHGPVGTPGSDLPGKAELCADRAWEIYHAVERAAREAAERGDGPADDPLFGPEEEVRVISQDEF